MPPLLIESYPTLRGLPWVSLASLPTPLERIEAGGREFLIKRDDLSSTSYGGNKVRKLEFILAHAREMGASRVITAGAAGSHHALATALYARQLGLRATLVLFPQPLNDHVREILLADAGLGAELRFAARMTAVPAAVMAARLAHMSDRVYVIAPGGSDPYGTLGYVNAMLELAEQVRDQAMEPPATIVVAAGTMGTAAGIALGAQLLGWPTRVAAVRITSRLVTNEIALQRLVRSTAALLARHGLRIDDAAAGARIELLHSQVGLGYGKSTDAADAALSAFRERGLELDVTYTAKAAAELLGAERPGVLYWHTLSGKLPDLPAADPATLPRRFREYLAQA